MIRRLIEWSLRNRLLVLLATLLLAGWGVYSAQHMALDAIPDLSDTQVIVKTGYPGQSPQAVEDQVTYPLASALLSVPGSTAVRGFSMFGESYIYVIFKEGTDPYWARSRVLEYLSQMASRLPAGVSPTLGPDASGVGWVFQYALVDRHHRYDADRLRAVQDFYLKYELQSLPGVAEVASVGGMARQFQIEEICRVYGVPPFMVGHNEKTTSWGSGVAEMGTSFVRYVLRSHLNAFQNEINRKFFRTAKTVAEFDTFELERADLKTLFETFRSAIGRAGEDGFMTVQEVRRLISYPATPEVGELNKGQANEPQPAA